MSTPSTPPAPQHLDLDALADLLAGEGSETAVAHLSTCAACSGALADLDAAGAPVTAALGALPDPPPPPGLDDRLTAALASAGPVAPAPVVTSGAGNARREEDDEPAPPRPAPRPVPPVVRSSTVTPQRSARATWLPAAAAAVLLLCAGGLVAALAGRTGSGESQSASAPAAAGPLEDSSAGEALAGTAVSASGRDYQPPGALEGALPGVLAGQAGSALPEQTPGLERLREPAALADCLRALLPPEDPGARPLALDYAAYAGAPALLVVLPASDPAKLDAFVVGAACSATNDATLFFGRFDRP